MENNNSGANSVNKNEIDQYIKRVESIKNSPDDKKLGSFLELIDIARRVLNSLEKVVDGAAKEGVALQDVCKSLSDVILTLSNKADVTSSDCVALAELCIKALEIMKDINKTNKSFWLKISGMVMCCFVAIIAIFAAGKKK